MPVCFTKGWEQDSPGAQRADDGPSAFSSCPTSKLAQCHKDFFGSSDRRTLFLVISEINFCQTETWGPTRRAQWGSRCPRALADPPGTARSLWSPCGRSSENSHVFLKNVTVQFGGRRVDPCSLPRKPLRVLTITVKCLILESK